MKNYNISVFGDLHVRSFNNINIKDVDISVNIILEADFLTTSKQIYKTIKKNLDYAIFQFCSFDIASYKSFLDHISTYLPADKIIVCGSNPPNPIEIKDSLSYSQELNKLSKLNFEIQSLCKELNIKYFDVFGEILNKNNILHNLYRDFKYDKDFEEHHINKRFSFYISKLTKKTNEALLGRHDDDLIHRSIDSHYAICGTFKPYEKPKVDKSKYPNSYYTYAYDHILNIDTDSETKRKLKDQFLLKEGDHVLELGAYIGLGARYLSRKVGTTGKVLSIEGIKSNYDLLLKNTSCCDNIHTYNTCISFEDAVKTLYTSSQQLQTEQMNEVHKKHGYDGKRPSQQLETRSVDSLFEKEFKNMDFHPTYITIELNLSEYDALIGMKNLLESSNYMRVVVAAWYDESMKNDIINFLSNIGFKVFVGCCDRIYASKGLNL